MITPAEHDRNLLMTASLIESLGRKRFSVVPILKTYSPESVKRIGLMFFDEDGNRVPTSGKHTGLAKAINNGANEAYINEILVNVPALPYKAEMNLMACISSIYHYRRLGWLPPLEQQANPLTTDFMLANKRITEHFSLKEDDDDDDFDGTHRVYENQIIIDIPGENGTCRTTLLTDEAFVRLLWERAADSHRILKIVRERDSADTELLLSILDNDAPSLGEGVL